MELSQHVDRLSKAVTALTEFNRELHKALKEISAPDLSQVKVSVDFTSVQKSVEDLNNAVKAIGEIQAEQDEKLNKLGELLFEFIEANKPVEAPKQKQGNSKG